MASLTTLLADLRIRLSEVTADFYTDAELTNYINYAYKRFIALTEWTERIKAYPMVANQFEYALPSDLMKINMIRYEDQWDVTPKDLGEFARYAGQGDQESDRPEIYGTFPTDTTLRIYPIPSAASASTTITGVHNSTTTSLTVGDTSSFPDHGRAVLNDSEQVFYFAKDSTHLLQVVRGDGYSTAASYVGAETVKYAPMEVYMNYMPAAIASSDTTRVGPVYDEALIFYAMYTALLKRDRYKEAGIFKGEFEALAKLAREERNKMHRDALFYIKCED